MTDKTEDLTAGLPEWLHPGQPVVWVRDDTVGLGDQRFARAATVERLTKTLIVLDNGQRFSRRDVDRDKTSLTRHEYRGKFHSERTMLLPPDDPKVAALRRSIQRENVRTRARNALRDAASRRDAPLEVLIEARDALDALITQTQEDEGD